MSAAGVPLVRLPSPDGARPVLLAAGVALAGLLVGVGAGVAPSLTLAAGGGLVFAVVVFRDLAAGTALYAFSIFAFQIPGLTGAAGATPIKAIAALLVLSWLLRLLSSRGSAPFLLRDAPWLGWFVAGLVLVALVSVVWAVVPGTALSGALRLFQSVLPVFVAYTALREPRHVRWVLWAYVAGCALATTAAVLIQGSSLAGTDETGRLATAVLDPNYLAAALIPALVLALFGLAVVRSVLARVGLVVAAIFFLFGLYLTQSRGGIVALLLCAALTPFLAGPLRARALALLLSVGAVALVVFTLVAPPQDLGRFAQIGGGGTGRIDIWKVAKQTFDAHPILGVGQDNFVNVEQQYAIDTVSLQRFDIAASGHTVTHNLYLELLTELGLVGLGLFLALAAAALLAGRRAIRLLAATPGALGDELLARAVTIGLVGLLAAYVFLAAEYEKPLWLMLGIAIALPRVARDRLASSYDVQDADVISQFDELEQRIESRLEALLGEQRRLARRQAELAQREQRVREHLRELETPPHAVESALGAPELESLAARFEQALARQQQATTEAIEALRRSIESLADRLGEALSRQQHEAVARDDELAARFEQAQQRAPEPAGPSPEDEARRAAVEAHERQLAEREELLEQRLAGVARRELTVARQAAEVAERERSLAAQPQESRPAPPPAVVPPAPTPLPVAPTQPAEPLLRYDALERAVEASADRFPERAEEWRSYLFSLREYAAPDGTIPAQFASLVEDVFGDLEPWR